MKFASLVSAVLSCVPVVRREIRELSPRELARLTNAINQIHRQGKVQEFTRTHLDNVPFAHAVPAFLPWHRYYLRRYEMALQEIDPAVVLPYWDWSLDSQAPHRSRVLSSAIYGGNGQQDMCVQDGPFAGWQMTVPDNHCLRRDFDRGSRIQPFSYPEEITLFLNDPTFSVFSRLLEEKHFYPHLFIGGERGDFNPMWSPNDPLFFLHHAFVDLLWAKWQQRHPHSNPYDGARYRLPAALDDTFTPWTNITVQSTLDTTHPFYCYTYPEYPRPVFASHATRAQKRQFHASFAQNPFFNGFLANATFATAPELLRTRIDALLKQAPNPQAKAKITPAGPFTERWINQIGLDLVEFRKSSDDSILLAQLLNQLPGFESVAAFQALFN